AVYRICQAAVREAVWMDIVRRFALQLAVAPRPGLGHTVSLQMDIEFSPYAQPLPPLQPLPAIFDRVLAEGGRYLQQPLPHGQRHVIEFDA
nr:hypothetical protein [Arenimonas sp.]